MKRLSTSMDPGLARAAYAVMSLLDHTIVIGGVVGTTVTGILLAVFTSWGLTRFYWILVKVIATPICVVLQVFAMGPLLDMAVAGGVTPVRLIGALTGHLVTMSAIVVISTLKPWGRHPQRPALGRN